MAWLTGKHAIAAAIEAHREGTLFVQRKNENGERLAEAARSAGLPVRYVTTEKLRRLAGGDARIAAFQVSGGAETAGNTVDLEQWLAEASGPHRSPILALDHITDPHNLGAIIRSAHWFGVALVVIPERRSATGGDVVARTSAGAVALTTISYVSNLKSALVTLRNAGYWVYAADGGGSRLDSIAFNDPSVLVLGAEGAGISPGIRKAVDATVAIPRFRRDASTVDSLNVSVSAGVLLYEYSRRRGENATKSE